MVVKKLVNQAEDLLDKVYRFSEIMAIKFELVSCNFLKIGLAKSVFVDKAKYVNSEMPMQNKVT